MLTFKKRLKENFDFSRSTFSSARSFFINAQRSFWPSGSAEPEKRRDCSTCNLVKKLRYQDIESLFKAIFPSHQLDESLAGHPRKRKEKEPRA
jgi:hypothetical protein